MCAICGIIGEDIDGKLYNMLLTLKHRGPDRSGVFVDGEISLGNLEDVTIPTGNFGLGHNLLSIVGSEVVQPLKHGKIVVVCNGEIYNYSQLHSRIEDESDYEFKTDSDSEVVLAIISEFYVDTLLKTIPLVVEQLEGDYAFAAYDGKDLIVVRDPVGVKPLYYGSNGKFRGFASERKALWKVGITETHSLAPNFMLHNQTLVSLPERLSWKKRLNNNKLKGTSHNYNGNIRKNPFYTTNKDYLKYILKNKLTESVEKRIRGLERVGILFSGGVDSTILAVLCKDLGVETELYAVGSEASPDLNFAQEVSEDIGLPLQTRVVNEELIRECTPIVLNAIEEWNLMKLGVGMTVYLAAEMAHENDFRVMLSGQGADELFAGYNRYLDFYHEKGEKAQKDLRNDMENIYHVNLERDDKVTMASSVELRVPYLDLQIINIALDIPMKYKINGANDRLRKCILREVASDMGVPQKVVIRPKKAAQYGSGIHKILTRKVLKDSEYMEKLKNSFKFIDI